MLCRNLTLPGDTRGIPTLNPCLGEVFYNATGFNESTELSQDNIAAFTSGKVGDYNKILSDNNVVFASFTAETDVMASFSIPASEQRKLLDASQGSSVLTVTAFRGNISSPPMFISSKSPELTKGSGIVKRIGLTIGLGMLFRTCRCIDATMSGTDLREFDHTYVSMQIRESSSQEGSSGSCLMDVQTVEQTTPALNTPSPHPIEPIVKNHAQIHSHATRSTVPPVS